MSLMETSLAALASSIPGVVDVDDVVVRIADVTHDSRLVDAETMFVAVRGASTDGHRFVDAAVAAGAPAVMVEARSSAGVPEIVVTDTRAAMAHLARSVHGLPDTAMTMIGVTGTNGKTTVCSMVEAVARAAGRRVGVIGTLGARIDGVPVSLERTTPESTDLQRLLATMRDGGVDVVAMEVSSHAMALHRADGIAFDVTAFTNLSQDHLDFHHTMEAYFAEKRKLFEPDRTAAAVVCVDDPYGRQLADAVSVDCTTVATEGDRNDVVADLIGSIVNVSPDGQEVAVKGDGVAMTCHLPMVGKFNVANALVSIAIGHLIGVDDAAIVAGLAGLQGVAGRMQRVSSVDVGSTPSVYVDYAHTPAAVDTVVREARRLTDGRLIVAVGAGGDRDRDKRTAMGHAAATAADLVIVTNDNPRSEDPATIATTVAEGARSADSAMVEVVLDRRMAIERAVEVAEPGDVVLILGKGHEQGQDIGGVVAPFDDVVVAAEALGSKEPV